MDHPDRTILPTGTLAVHRVNERGPRKPAGIRVPSRTTQAHPDLTASRTACCPGFSFRHSDPVEARWWRMIPDTNVKVLRDNGSPARQESTQALAAVKVVLAGCLLCLTGAGTILLWALRSPCDLGCLYCYFGTIEEHRAGPGVQEGQLSHLSRADLPAPAYPGQVAAAITAPVSGVQSCFGGSTLAFIEPDGSLWDCPCWLRIAVTPPAPRATTRGADARTVNATSRLSWPAVAINDLLRIRLLAGYLSGRWPPRSR